MSAITYKSYLSTNFLRAAKHHWRHNVQAFSLEAAQTASSGEEQYGQG
jgi:hypothetical protein